MTGSVVARASRHPLWTHVAIAAVLAVLTVVLLHDVGFILTRSLWLDESWVAISGRLPLDDLPRLTSSTPIGWNLLQRLFDPLGDQAPRLLPLAFSGAATAAGYALGVVAWPGRVRLRIVSGVAVATAVAFAPLMLQRNDLKQYTSDVFFTLLIWALAVAWDVGRRRSTLIALTAVAAFGLLFSLIVAFAAASAFGALVIAMLVRRQWRPLIESLVGGAIGGAGIALWYLLFYRQTAQGALGDFWKDFYPSFGGLRVYLLDRIQILAAITPHRAIALGIALVLVIVVHLVLAIAARRPAGGLFIVVLCLGMIAAGVLRIYPLLDARTSLFLLVGASALTMVTAVRLVELAWGLLPRPVAAQWAALVTIAALIAPAAIWGSPWLRTTVFKDDDTLTLIDYLDAHRGADDPVAVDFFSSFSYAYYQRDITVGWRPSTVANGFQVTFPGDHTVDSFGGGPGPLIAAYHRALRGDPGGTFWVLTAHKPIDVPKILGSKAPVSVTSSGVDKLYRVDLAAGKP